MTGDAAVEEPRGVEDDDLAPPLPRRRGQTLGVVVEALVAQHGLHLLDGSARAEADAALPSGIARRRAA